MIGADICGFVGNTTEELCARWIEVGAFYPFARNHNSLNQMPQELYLWDSVTEAAKNALGIRYRILPYLYTLFYKANTLGETVARALWLNFPSDPKTAGISSQFMLGSAILVSPVLFEGATTVDAYFPQGLWYCIKCGMLKVDASAGGITKTLDAALTEIPVHLKGGSILPEQEAMMTTTESRKTPFTLTVALCEKGKAFGELYYDDGEQVSVKEYVYVSYAASNNSLKNAVNANTFPKGWSPQDGSSTKIGKIQILGKDLAAPKAVTLNGQTVDCTFDSDKKLLTISGILGLDIRDNLDLHW
jgi:alpha-glucosidase